MKILLLQNEYHLNLLNHVLILMMQNLLNHVLILSPLQFLEMLEDFELEIEVGLEILLRMIHFLNFVLMILERFVVDFRIL